MQKMAAVFGAGGFIGSHLVKRLKREGYLCPRRQYQATRVPRVRRMNFALLDLREPKSCREALALQSGRPDAVYRLAADSQSETESSTRG